jgi:hypothetical protein
MCPRRLVLTLALLAAFPFATPAAAQDSRAALLAQQREAKAAALRPYRPGRIERALLYIEQREPIRWLTPYDGFYVQSGFTDKPVGSGLAFGGGYRHDLFGRRARIVLETGLSVRNYQLARADFFLSGLARGRVELGVKAAYRHYPQEDFYGFGSSSRLEDRVSFLYESTDVQGRAIVRPRRWLEIGGRTGVLNPRIGPGKDGRYPSVEDGFTGSATPGLERHPAYRYAEAFGAVDTRDQDGNPRAGGFYGVSFRRYEGRGGLEQGFHVLDADLQQFIPIFDKKRVIALRGRVISTVGENGGEVPFYFQPTLGGSDSLRSYPDYRFRDRNIISLNAEYRWEAFTGMDMALFSDWGKVAARHGNVDLGSLKRAYGVGFRFNTYKTVFCRFDVAAGGGEGLRYHLKFSNVF